MQHIKEMDEKAEFECLNEKDLQEIDGGGDKDKMGGFFEEIYEAWQKLMKK